MARMILVSGSRNFSRPQLVRQIITRLVTPSDQLMHGCARGVDTWAGEAAESQGASILKRPADWNRHGKRAGIIRNEQMLQEARQHPNLMVVIFWDGQSRGTKHMIDLCVAAHLPHQIIQPGDGQITHVVDFH